MKSLFILSCGSSREKLDTNIKYGVLPGSIMFRFGLLNCFCELRFGIRSTDIEPELSPWGI